MKGRLTAGFEKLGIVPPADAVDKLVTYGEMLIAQNEVMNLTAITEPNQVADLHFLDSAAVLGCCDLAGKSLIDVGTGAGFPGMVLKTLVPSLDLTLADSLAKRLSWLDEVATTLGMTGVQTVHCRAEELGHDPKYREQFDFATARAVSELAVLCELCLPFIQVGGRFLAMKATQCDQEIADATGAIEVLGGRVVEVFDYAIPGQAVERHVVVIEKIGATPEKYPRRWAQMVKKRL